MDINANLAGKVVLVTGGSRGLGRVIATEFAAAGCDVVVASRKLPACEEVATDLQRSFGRRAVGIACHVGVWSDCERLVSEVYRVFGRFDVLINNAGVSPAYDRSIDTLSEELFDKIIAVNLKGPFRLCALAGSRMAAHGGGAIVNISSSAASHPEAAAIPYSAAKAGVNAMTKALAALFGPTVRVNCIQPWGIATDMSRHIMPDAIAVLARDHAIKRFARPEEIARAAVFLASEASSFTTGTILRVDGGMPG
jgi:NAD(P)-dependent dehydrogenase (short-subunit alcohol dehydrogenase family)